MSTTLNFNAKAFVRVLTIGALALATSLSVRTASAQPQDYRFELDGQPVKSGKATLIKVRLVHVPDGKPVPGAIIIQTKLDMGPDGMTEMGAPAKASPSSEPGLYQIEAQPSMAGRWGLTLAAKVQGETETVRGTVIVPVAK
ncbi:MAG TPA: FixH family protein [Alphaproteobacteria bacterium]|nr:FixH family protein [Alphaproteobacteria bacterium]